MKKQNKIIVGAVVLLAVYYLYDRNRKMKKVADLKEGANLVVGNSELVSDEVKSMPKPVLKEDTQLNFYGSK